LLADVLEEGVLAGDHAFDAQWRPGRWPWRARRGLGARWWRCNRRLHAIRRGLRRRALAPDAAPTAAP
jgi:hypothetical protein